MKRWLPLLSLLFVIVMIGVMRWQGQSLVTPVSPRGIIDLEFAQTGERWRQLLLFLNGQEIIRNLQLDFLFIVSYVAFFLTSLRFFQQRNGWQRWPPRFAAFGMAAGLFDVLENFLLLLVLNQRFDTDVLPFVNIIAWVKFILAAEVLLYLLFCTFSRLRRPATRRVETEA